jgi:hypothetical protein
MRSLTTTCLTLTAITALAQAQSLPSGIYLNLDQLKARAPAAKATLNVTRRSSGDIVMMGGNDYRLEGIGDTLETKYLKRDVYAYASNDSLFLNCFHQKLGPWYALALCQGEFLVYRAAITTPYAWMGGAVGGAIAAGNRQLYVLSLRTGNTRPLNKEYVIARLEDRGMTELLSAYTAEGQQDSVEVLLRYVELLNADLAAGAGGSGP